MYWIIENIMIQSCSRYWRIKLLREEKLCLELDSYRSILPCGSIFTASGYTYFIFCIFLKRAFYSWKIGFIFSEETALHYFRRLLNDFFLSYPSLLFFPSILPISSILWCRCLTFLFEARIFAIDRVLSLKADNFLSESSTFIVFLDEVMVRIGSILEGSTSSFSRRIEMSGCA